MTRLKRNGVAWEVAPDFEPCLDQLLADAGEAVKQTPTKLVTRHQFGGRTLYLKRYLNAVGLRPLKYFFKKSEARNEWGLAARYAALGIPVVRHLALGERWGATGLQESLLVTEGFDGVPLSRGADHQAPAVQVLLGQLLRKMHDGGVLQRDLQHNILVRAAPLELRRIDVDRGELHERLTDDQRLENLAYLNVFVPLGERFFRGYGADAEWARRVAARSTVLHRQVAAARRRRCLEENLRFTAVKAGELRWWVRREALDDRLRALLADPAGALAGCARLFKSGPGRQSTVGAFDGLVLKQFHQKNRWNYLKDIFRPSRAFRAYEKAYHLELLGLPTPRPVAAAERRCARVVWESYLVTEEIRGGSDLRSLTTLAVAVAARAGALVGRLHCEGFGHGDLKETNLLVDAVGKLYLVDLDSLRYQPPVPERLVADDLARLARGAAKYPVVTAAHRRAFLRAYVRARGIRKLPRV